MSGETSQIVLTVTRPAAPPEDVTASVTLGPRGGTVGRAQGCDMVLPDPGNLVSRRHFEVSLRDGRFEAVDLSSNGLFVNGAGTPVGNGRSVVLSEGDRLGVGDYQVTVERVAIGGTGGGAEDLPEIEKSFSGNPFAAPGPARSAPAGGVPAREGAGDNPFGLPEGLERNPFEDEDDDWPGGPEDAVAPSIGAERDDADTPLIPDDFDPLEDLGLGPDQGAQSDHAPGWNVPLDNVMRQAPRAAPESEPVPPESEPEVEPAREERADRPDRTSPGAAAPQRPAEPAPAPDASAAPEEAMAAFWKAAGIDPDLARNAGPEAAGALFGALVRGLWEVLRARTAFKEEFRVERTMLGAQQNNPIKFAIDPDQALESLARGGGRGFMEPMRAVEESFDDIRNHEMAMVAAMHRALSHVLEEFDPQALESKLEGMSLLDALPGGRRARNWDLYVKHYAEIAKKAEDIFEGALGREFVRAYERAAGGNRRGGSE